MDSSPDRERGLRGHVENYLRIGLTAFNLYGIRLRRFNNSREECERRRRAFSTIYEHHMVLARNHSVGTERAVAGEVNSVGRNRRPVPDSEKENLTVGKIKTGSNYTTTEFPAATGLFLSTPSEAIGSLRK